MYLFRGALYILSQFKKIAIPLRILIIITQQTLIRKKLTNAKEPLMSEFCTVFF
jgi:hypothetical protein